MGIPWRRDRAGETPEEAARREYGEECGGKPYAGALTPLYTSSDGFQCFGATGYAEPHLNDEHTDWGWFDFDDLPTPLHPGMKEIKMPSVSEKQHRAMEAAAHGKSTLGIPKKVGEEFVDADKPAKDGARDEFLQAVDAIHQCALDCMAYDKRK